MIRRPDGKDWLLIAQPEHAAVCGAFAERWGSGDGEFAPVHPRESVVLAAREHDNGWAEWEAAPTADPATGRPRHFTEMPVPEYLPIWRRGVRRAAARDPYAGLLVSLHADRLLAPRHRAGRDAPDDRDALRQFLEEQEGLRAGLRRALDMADETVAAHSRLVATWDRLSLLLCCGPIPAATLEDVPARRGAAPIAVGPDGERSAALDPYPFAGGRLELALPARRVPARPYPTADALRAALATAPVETLTFTLHPA